MSAGRWHGEAPVYDLDPALIGQTLIAMLAASVQLCHGQVARTARDYCEPGTGSPETEFVRDVLAGSTDDAANRWFGCRHNAQVHAQDAAFGDGGGFTRWLGDVLEETP